MNNYQYYKPFYLPNFKPIYPLKNNGDSSVMFFEVKYRIRPESYKSRTKGETEFPPLTNIIDYTGKNIIPSWVDKSKYRRLKEDVEEETFYNVVTETYGYTPTSKFEKNTITAWTRPAIASQVNVGEETLPVDSFSYDEATGAHTLYFTTNVINAEVGDSIKLKSSLYYVEDDYRQESFYQEATTVIKQVNADSVTVDAFIFSEKSQDGNTYNTYNSNSEESAFNKEGITFVATFYIQSELVVSGVGDVKNGLVEFKQPDGYKFKTGDIVRFSFSGSQSGLSQFYPWSSADVEILYADDKVYKVEDFEVYIKENTVNYSNLSFGPANLYFARVVGVSGRNAFQGDFIGKQVVEYKNASELVNLRQQWQPTTGRNYTDTISGGSTPTINEYYDMVANGTMLLAQPQTAELFMGDVYKITSVYVKAQ